MPGKIQKFFVPPNSELWRVPRSQYQQDSAGSQHADTHEKILIRQMYARNTVEARLLMKKYEATTAYEVILAINRQKPSVMQRLERSIRKLIRRIEGSTKQKVQIRPDKSSQWRLPR